MNGLIFINNSSIGLYPAIVQQRSRHQSRGLKKVARLRARHLHRLRRVPQFQASLHADGKYDGSDRTPFIFVGNNPYQATGLRSASAAGSTPAPVGLPGTRRRPRGAHKMAVRALFGHASPGELKVLEAEELWVQTRKNKSVKVANDGEVFSTAPPLHYRIRPQALRVIVPAGTIQDA